ncbi:hypothetical protein [Actinoallomurus rhizosphaericola]|uniref:hypothetical protein n=1 Tax=Actinoallomurus rhizosphaericola TaxID=2952536 RepID=UPI002093CFCE|nr:hypothetical protein [Actinoallomurus rhizosphaericola]MCO6000066.1 hypothetical protein [Actinoallomurus rhizosphaericola]
MSSRQLNQKLAVSVVYVAAPVGAALVFRTFPPQERVRASSIILIPTALAPALRPVVGELLVT